MEYTVIECFQNKNRRPFMQTNSFVHRLTKVLIESMFFGGILCCAALPFFLPWLTKLLGHSRRDVILYFTVMLELAGLCALYILYQLKAMFKTLLDGNPFVSANVACLRKCGAASFLIALLFLADSLVGFTIASILFVIIFALLGLFSLTLKDVFKQAVVYKEENDFTV